MAENERKSTAIEERRPAPVAQVAREQERALAEVKGAIAIAMGNPRDMTRAIERIKASCRRPALAEAAQYSYPRAGKQVVGPTIRLAEAIAQAWGNLHFGRREISRSESASIIQTYCWDLEVNTRSEVEFEVPHVQYSREQGNKRLVDPRDIYEAVANQAARRVRSCILAMIPGDVIDTALKECDATLEAEMTKDGKTMAERIKNCEAAFSKHGVTKKMIEAYLRHPIDSMSRAELMNLGKIINAIQEEGRKPSEYFAMGEKPKDQAADLRSEVAQRAEQKRGGTGIVGRVFGGRKDEPPSAEREREPGEDDPIPDPPDELFDDK